MAATRDRLLELQQRSAIVAPAAATSPPAVVVNIPADNSNNTGVNNAAPTSAGSGGRSGRLAKMFRRLSTPANVASSEASSAAADVYLLSLGEISGELAGARADVEEVRRQQCRQLNSPRHQRLAWTETQQLSSALLGRLGRLRARIDALQTKVRAHREELTATEAHLVQVQINSARTQLLAVVEQFNQEECSFRERKRDHLKRQLKITGTALDDAELENLIDQGDPQIFNQGILQQVETARLQLSDAEDRYRQIHSLETSIEQLHEMFQQLSLLVAGQGELVDRIEDNTIRTVTAADKGKQELGSALQKQRKGRKLMIGCGVFVAILLLILVVIIASYVG